MIQFAVRSGLRAELPAMHAHQGRCIVIYDEKRHWALGVFNTLLAIALFQGLCRGYNLYVVPKMIGAGVILVAAWAYAWLLRWVFNCPTRLALMSLGPAAGAVMVYDTYRNPPPEVYSNMQNLTAGSLFAAVFGAWFAGVICLNLAWDPSGATKEPPTRRYVIMSGVLAAATYAINAWLLVEYPPPV